MLTRFWERLERFGAKLGMSPRLLKFCVVGGSGVVVNLGVLYVLLVFLPDGWAEWRPRVASIAGIAVSILTNFLLNDIWTWADRAKKGRLHWFQRLAKFILVSSVAALVQFALFVLLFEYANLRSLLGERIGGLCSQCIGIICALVINYIANNYWTFGEKTEGES